MVEFQSLGVGQAGFPFEDRVDIEAELGHTYRPHFMRPAGESKPRRQISRDLK